MTENQRLKIIQTVLKFPSQEKFASALGIKQGSLSDIYREKGGVGVSDSIKRKLEKEFSINIDWLETGEGSMLKTDASNLLPAGTHVVVGKNEETQMLLPVYDTTTSTDSMSLFNGNLKVENYILIPNLPKCDGAMLVHGDQMSPELRPGSIVVYKRVKDIGNIWFGQMYIVAFDYRDDQHIVVKYIHESEKNEYIKLVSVNPKYPPVEIPTDSIKALAEIKASVRYNLWV